MSPSQYSLFFSVNAVSFFGVSQISGWLTEKYGLKRVVRIAVFGFAGRDDRDVGGHGDGLRIARR